MTDKAAVDYKDYVVEVVYSRKSAFLLRKERLEALKRKAKLADKKPLLILGFVNDNNNTLEIECHFGAHNHYDKNK